MVILHIACIKNDLFNGVCVAVPQHIRAQSTLATVGLVNVNQMPIEGVACQLDHENDFDVNALPSPFCKPDIVVFHEAYRIEYLKIARNLNRNKIPYVIIPHGELNREAQRKKRLKKMAANILLFNRFINGAVAVQCLSQRELDNTDFGRRKFIGSNGVSMPMCRKTAFREDSVKFVYVGRLEMSIKGLDLMIEAVRLQADSLRASGFSLDIYGPDHQGRAEAVEALIREKQVGDLISLHGPVTGAEKERVLLDADIFMQTSRTEGMPMGILEALSYGIPCLVTEGTTLAGMIRSSDAGWGCETEAAALSQMLVRAVAEKEQYASKSQHAVSFAEHHFAWEHIAAEAVKEYSKLCRM